METVGLTNERDTKLTPPGIEQHTLALDRASEYPLPHPSPHQNHPCDRYRLIIILALVLMSPTLRRASPIPHTVLTLFALVLLLPGASAMPATRPLSLITVNATGLPRVGETSTAIAHILEALSPHVLIITETHHRAAEQHDLPRDYKRMYDPHTTYDHHALPHAKRGVLILVNRAIPIIRRVDTSALPHASGRVTAVDIMVPDVNAKPRLIRVVGVTPR